ncbi:MAG: C45 family peptidase [Solirubrobacterales bacterium]
MAARQAAGHPDFPVLTLEGSAAARGVAYGRLAADRIRNGLDFYRGIFAAAGFEGRRLEEASARMAETIGRFDPDMLLELEGIARGAEVTLSDVISLNARSELMRTSEDGCTSAACLPESTATGHTLLGQNWDWHPSRAATGVLIRVRPENCPGFLTFAEAGVLARCGLNERGIGVVGNALECQGCTRPGGVPVALIRRRILGSESLAEAARAVREAPRGTSVNHFIASAEGDAVACETTPEKVFEVRPEAGLLGHSNHFLAPSAQEKLADTGIAAHPDTLRRAPRIEELLAARRPVEVVDVEAAFRDHGDYPNSICRHAEVVDPSTWTTVASVVMDLDERRMWIAAGPPCEATFAEHLLT